MSKKILLTQNKFAVVDDDDFEYLSQFNWDTKKSRGTFYARRFLSGKRIMMHNEIMKPTSGMFVDHIDGNGQNNQKSNLRICTFAQNNRNASKRKDNTSGFKGVSKAKNGKWYAQVRINGKHVLSKLFDSPIDAAHAYDEAAKQYFGEFARTNF